MKYAVHLYPSVRVKVTGVEANSAAEAASLAQSMVDLHALLDNPRPAAANVEAVEWGEGETEFLLVDPLDERGQVIYEASQYLEGDGTPLVDGKTQVERKAAAADEAELFMKELLDSVETLTSVAEIHGARTLADLMYLHAAILKDGFIDSYPEDSAVEQVVSALPSAERWRAFIKREYMDQEHTPKGERG
jgi:hypothetical protein